MSIDLLLEAKLDVGEAHAGEGAQALAAAERQHDVIELANFSELGRKCVRRGGVHRHCLRVKAEASLCLAEASFIAPGNRDPGARFEKMTGGRKTDPR